MSAAGFSHLLLHPLLRLQQEYFNLLEKDLESIFPSHIGPNLSWSSCTGYLWNWFNTLCFPCDRPSDKPRVQRNLSIRCGEGKAGAHGPVLGVWYLLGQSSRKNVKWRVFFPLWNCPGPGEHLGATAHPHEHLHPSVGVVEPCWPGASGPSHGSGRYKVLLLLWPGMQVCIHQRHRWALSWKASVLARGAGAENRECWKQVLWWCWWWEQQRWVSVWAGAQLPVLLGLGSSVIKMAMAFQFPGICIGLGKGVGQCLYYQMERKMHIVLACMLSRQWWLIVKVSGSPVGGTSWCRK